MKNGRDFKNPARIFLKQLFSWGKPVRWGLWSKSSKRTSFRSSRTALLCSWNRSKPYLWSLYPFAWFLSSKSKWSTDLKLTDKILFRYT